MTKRRYVLALSTSLLFGLAGSGFAAAPLDDADDIARSTRAPVSVPHRPLNKETVVHGWVLCVSQGVAIDLARARENGPAAVRDAYAVLSRSKACGRFPEMTVILQDRIFETSLPGGGDQSVVFRGEVRMTGSWASVFIVAGVPEVE